MIRVLFIVPYPVGKSPSQRFRFEQYFPALEKNGYTLHTASFWTARGWQVLYSKGNAGSKFLLFVLGLVRRVVLLFSLHRYRIVFIHREALPIGPPVLEWFITRVWGKRTIYDFDDAIWLPNTSRENRFASALKWHSKVSSICKWSNTISVGNKYLAAYAGKYNNHVIVNPTTVDTDSFHPPSSYPQLPQEKISIGWTGTHSTLKYLAPLIPVLDKLDNKFKGRLKFVVIADRPPAFQHDLLEFIPWKKETEVADLRRIHIGVMPLTDDPWAKGKCGFKGLLYMSLGIPAVMSPVGVNTEIVTDGVDGFLAGTESEWVTKISSLVEDGVLRMKIGEAGRKTVVDRFSVASQNDLYVQCFNQLL